MSILLFPSVGCIVSVRIPPFAITSPSVVIFPFFRDRDRSVKQGDLGKGGEFQFPGKRKYFVVLDKDISGGKELAMEAL